MLGKLRSCRRADYYTELKLVAGRRKKGRKPRSITNGSI